MAVIAVVEDDAQMRAALASLVELFGYEARAFEGPKALLSAFSTAPFGCVISDMRMPEIDGLALQRGLKFLAPALPIIFVTSYEDPATRRRAIQQGARAVLSKPVRAAALQKELEAALASDLAM